MADLRERVQRVQSAEREEKQVSANPSAQIRGMARKDRSGLGLRNCRYRAPPEEELKNTLLNILMITVVISMSYHSSSRILLSFSVLIGFN